MKKSQNAETIANDIRMRRTIYEGAFLIVEGNSDLRFFTQFVNDASCQIITANGKDIVFKVCDILRGASFRGYVGIVDGDYNQACYSFLRRRDICITDDHDIECMLVKGTAFDKVVFDLASAEKLRSWRHRFGKNLREHLVTQAVNVGLLLMHSNLCGLNLSFEDLEPGEYINTDTLTVENTKLIVHVKNRSSRHDLDTATLCREIEELRDINFDCWKIIRGADVIAILGLGLRSALGSNNALAVSRESLERLFRMAYPVTEFQTSVLYAMLRDWEASNQPYQIVAV